MTPLSAHDLDDGIVVIASRGMYWYACRLVNDDHVVVFVHRANWRRRDRRLMAMQGMTYDIAVLDDGVDRRHLFAVQVYRARFYGSFLCGQSDSGILTRKYVHVRSIPLAYL